MFILQKWTVYKKNVVCIKKQKKLYNKIHSSINAGATAGLH